MTRTQIVLVALTVGGAGGTALASFDNTMRTMGSDPASWGFATPIASLNAQTAGFSFQTNSGFVFEVLGTEFDRTDVITDVYQVNSPTVIDGVSLSTGDLVFAYRVTLVTSVPGSTVSSLGEAQVIGAPDFGFGMDPMDASLINGMGYVVPGHPKVPVAGNIDDAGPFGSSLDWEWPGSDVGNLDNDQSIVMLMFTAPASIGEGVLNLIAPPGQTGGITGVAQANEAPPVLIPIVPTPGTAFLGLLGSGFVFAGRRRSR